MPLGACSVPMSLPPGERGEINVPLWNAASREALASDQAIVCRSALLDPRGFRVLTHDLHVVPEATALSEAAAIPISPDAAPL